MILLLGLAGTGKSTQGQMLAERFGWAWLSAGQILRDSGQFQEILARGDLVDNTIVNQMVQAAVERCEAAGQKVVLDGFPRGSEQAQALVAQPELLGKIEVVFWLQASHAELKRRLLARGRADDTEAAIAKRLADGHDLVDKVIEILASHRVKVVKIDGEGTEEEVFTRIADYVRLAGLAQDVVDPRVEAGGATVTERSDTGCS